MDFKNFDMSDDDNYKKYLLKCIQCPADMSTATLNGYRQADSIVRAYADGFCWHKNEKTGTFFPPVGDWYIKNWEEILRRNIPEGATFEYVPECLMKIWAVQIAKYIEIQNDRDEWDYVYYLDHYDKDYNKAIKLMRKRSFCFHVHPGPLE